MAVQTRTSRLPTIAHSAAISAGNSGGPLVDACGRVVGINRFIRVSVDQASHAGFAIASDDVLRFLAEAEPDLTQRLKAVAFYYSDLRIPGGKRVQDFAANPAYYITLGRRDDQSIYSMARAFQSAAQAAGARSTLTYHGTGVHAFDNVNAGAETVRIIGETLAFFQANL